MENTVICDQIELCSIHLFSNNFSPDKLDGFYKKFCKNGSIGRNNCRRYQVIQQLGKCPPILRPDSSLSADEIVKIINKSIY